MLLYAVSINKLLNKMVEFLWDAMHVCDVIVMPRIQGYF